MIRILLILGTVLAGSTIGSAQSTEMFIQDISWSPDGKYLVFTGMHDIDRSANKMKADIYRIRVDGSDQKKITGDEKNEFYTSWVKGRIAFGSQTPGQKDSKIFTANADGSDLRQISSGAGRDSTPNISIDGKKIVFGSTRVYRSVNLRASLVGTPPPLRPQSRRRFRSGSPRMRHPL